MGIQGVIGIAMSACLNSLKKHIAGFVVVFGIFTTFGEFGPGDNIGLLASKTSATAIRGQYYGIAAAIGKIGAFVGTWVFPAIQSKYANNSNQIYNYKFHSILVLHCVFSVLVWQSFLSSSWSRCYLQEDHDFVQYLSNNGFDINMLGEGGDVREVCRESDSLEKEKRDDFQVDNNSL